MKLPEEFTGDRKKTVGFLQDIALHVLMNRATYNNDEKVVLLALSLMRGGTAGPWKQARVARVMNTEPYDWGTFASLRQDIEASFGMADPGGEARHRLKTLRQTGAVSEYNSQFEVIAAKSGINEDMALVEHYMDGLQPRLLEKVHGTHPMPRNLAEWKERALSLDNMWRRAREIASNNKWGDTRERTSGKKYRFTKPSYSKDPNAMEVDRLTTQERRRYSLTHTLVIDDDWTLTVLVYKP